MQQSWFSRSEQPERALCRVSAGSWRLLKRAAPRHASRAMAPSELCGSLHVQRFAGTTVGLAAKHGTQFIEPAATATESASLGLVSGGGKSATFAGASKSCLGKSRLGTIGHHAASCYYAQLLPNPSLKRSANGMSRWQIRRAHV